MGNTRSNARRSVDAFAMDDENSSLEPLLTSTDQDTAYQRKGTTRWATKQLQQDPVVVEESMLDLAAIVHQLECFYAIVWPVAITMVVTSFVACYARDPQLAKAMTTYMYYHNIDNSSASMGEKSLLALMNAIVVIGFIAVLSFGIVLLYKFNCMRFFLSYCMFYSASLLAFAGTKIVVVILGHDLHLIFDSVSHWFVMYNFAVVGVLSIFYQKGIPTVVEKGYLVAISVIVAWQLSQLPEWSIWMILLLLGFWDLFAVLTPFGPLRWLVDLVHEKGTPLPGLLYRADLTDSHRNDERVELQRPTQPSMSESEFIAWLLSPTRPLGALAPQSPPLPAHVLGFQERVVAFLFDQRSSAQYRALDLSRRYADQPMQLWQALYTYYEVQSVMPGKSYPPVEMIFPPTTRTENESTAEPTDAYEEDKSIRLGLGDFIFYSVLVARAAIHGVAPFVVCFFSVIAGLGITMYLLAHYDALPALPMSIFTGILAYLLTLQLVGPFVEYLTSFGTVRFFTNAFCSILHVDLFPDPQVMARKWIWLFDHDSKELTNMTTVNVVIEDVDMLRKAMKEEYKDSYLVRVAASDLAASDLAVYANHATYLTRKKLDTDACIDSFSVLMKDALVVERKEIGLPPVLAFQNGLNPYEPHLPRLQLLENVYAALMPQEDRLLLLVSPSASGKTSLLILFTNQYRHLDCRYISLLNDEVSAATLLLEGGRTDVFSGKPTSAQVKYTL